MKIINSENNKGKEIEFDFISDDKSENKKFTVNLREDSISEVQGLFDYVLKHIDKTWDFDLDAIKKDSSIEEDAALEYAALLEKEIGEIKAELVKMSVED